MNDLLQDLRYTFRTLRRDAGFTTFAILIVGLGIGASSTVFSVANTLLLRPLPFRDPERLVWIANHDTGGLSGATTQVSNMLDVRERAHSLTEVAAYFAFYGVGDNMLTGLGEPERLSGVPVSENFFPMLGVQPQIGRLFNADECKWKGPRAVLLSHGFWERRFNSDSAIVGKHLTLNDEPYSVIGVLPASFDFAEVFAPGSHFDLYFPFPLTPETNRWGNTMAMIGRLKPGVTPAAAQSELAAVAKSIAHDHAERNRNDFEGTPESARRSCQRSRASGGAGAGLRGRSGDADCVRQPFEPAAGAHHRPPQRDRDSHGIGRGTPPPDPADADREPGAFELRRGARCSAGGGRHARAGASGFHQHPAAARACAPMAPRCSSRWRWRCSPGWSSAWRRRCRCATKALHDALKDTGRGSTEGKGRHWSRNVLVVAEIAFACVLLVGAGLLIRSFLRVLDVDMGFHPERAAAVRVDPDSRYSHAGAAERLFRRSAAAGAGCSRGQRRRADRMRCRWGAIAPGERLRRGSSMLAASFPTPSCAS